eukprot:GHVN01029545.1.p1 GENE.GHVN01029545.1~~GHVN01029545.1.p1  ORF type:complete len:430 (-),score=58.73 GHVN01029545.1:1034-2278(-)
MSSRELDILLFGATGYTGSLVAEYLISNYGNKPLRFGFAARDLTKLKELQSSLEQNFPSAKNVTLIVADVNDEESIAKMCSRTATLITTVGPYVKYGEVVVKNCVDAGTNYCDLTGEPHWIRSMINKYHNKAEEKQIKIVTSCGFDAIPSDLGVFLLQKCAHEQLKAPLKSIDFRVVKMGVGTPSGGTAASILEMQKLDRKSLCEIDDPFYLCGNEQYAAVKRVKQPNVNTVYFDTQTELYTIPFIMEKINSRIVRRSNFLLNYKYGEDFKYHEATAFTKYRVLAQLMVWAFMVGEKLLRVGIVQKILSYIVPKPGQGPPLEKRKKGQFWAVLIGKTTDGAHREREFIANVGTDKGDPGYQETAKMISECALCLTQVNGPKIYGVITPASAFGMSLVDRLNDAGMTFRVSSIAC